jgi:hypothetical protein
MNRRDHTRAATSRRHLPNRRLNETFAFDWLGMNFVATISRFDDGAVGEIFLSNGRVNSHADTAARDSAVICSLALQHGVDLETLRRSLLRDSQGVASGPLGAALDLVASLDEPARNKDFRQ